MIYPSKRFFQIVQRICVGNSDISFSTCTKCTSRNNCDLLLTEQFRRKFFRRHPKLLNVREHIKCSKWLKATEPHFFKCMHKITSSLIICRAHLLDLIITVLQSLNCCILTVCRCTQDCVLMDFHHLLHDDLRSAYVPQSPSRHGKTF